MVAPSSFLFWLRGPRVWAGAPSSDFATPFTPLFHLGTSSDFSAIQRYRFVHGHVHILIPKLWGPFLGGFIFCIFHLGTSSAFSATQRYRFVHGHVHILIPKLWGPLFFNSFLAFSEFQENVCRRGWGWGCNCWTLAVECGLGMERVRRRGNRGGRLFSDLECVVRGWNIAPST